MTDYTDRTRKYRGTDRDALAEAVDPRRLAPGVRRASDYFAPENQRREVTRAEYINLRGSEEFARRESRWWRQVWRFFTNQPQVVDFNARTAAAHERSLDKVKEKLLADAAAMQDKLTERKKENDAKDIRESRDV